MKSKEKIIAPIVLEQSSLFELLLIVIVLAFGVNFVSDSFPSIFNLPPITEFIVGVVICLTTACYLVARFLGKRQQTRKYKSFLIYNGKQNHILSVPRYDFVEHINSYIKAAFFENSALKAVWEKEPLSESWKGIDVTNDKDKVSDAPRSWKMLSELVEYYVLEKLSIHLSDYFAQGNFAENNLRKYNREDIPDVLLSNRFLELFSKPMEDRSQFTDQNIPDNAVMASIGGRAFYNKFNLVLPRKSAIRRLKPHTIEISTDRMAILIQVKFDGHGVNLPVGFSESYLGIAKSGYYENFSEFVVNVEIKVEFKFGALLSTAGWEYYQWVDSFLDKLNFDLSMDEFFLKLNWENAYTIYMLQNQQENISNIVVSNDNAT